MAKDAPLVLELDGLDVTVTHPDKVIFPGPGLTKRDIVEYFLAVAPGALAGVAGRPMALRRFVRGTNDKPFYQKRAPEPRPEWIETVDFRYPSGGVASEIVVRDVAQLIWVINLNCVDLHPHAVRAEDLAHPDELRIDLDPVPGVPWAMVRDVALVAREVLADHGLVGFPKTSGSRGMHIYTRLAGTWTFTQVRTAGLALAREVARRAPDIATAEWWKEDRHGVFIDYNQNAKDRTTASAYSLRPTPDARVSAPLTWDEVPSCEPGEFTFRTVPERFAAIGDPAAGIDKAPGDLTSLLALAKAQKAAGMKEPAPTRTTAPSRAGPPAAGSGAIRPTGRRQSKMPLIEIARAADVDTAMAGLERWKARHPDVVAHLAAPDVLVDAMRGRSSTWTRIRVNLQHVPQELRPEQEPLESDYDPWEGLRRDQ
ncbi:DNA polymerase domain-containing protein [Luedemannella flava]|uniref:DNA polymerase domain-containing protein n=1 Tax=Luedemannella flava TaxID=349316 RepID=A0ABP4YA19_9ACTN